MPLGSHPILAASMYLSEYPILLLDFLKSLNIIKSQGIDQSK